MADAWGTCSRCRTHRLHDGLCEHCHIVLYRDEVEAKDKRIAALEEKLQDRLEVTDLVATAEEELTKARREGARRALEWFVRQPRGDDSVGWVLTKSYDQMIDAALGEVDGG